MSSKHVLGPSGHANVCNPGMEVDDEPEEAPPVHLTLSNLHALTSLLQAIKISSKQVCSVILDQEGVSIRWEEESKTLQSSIKLRSELFGSYECGGQQRLFGVNFSQLVDALVVFASASDAPLHLRYPGPDGELQLEMCEDGPDKPGSCVLYARIATLEMAAAGDLTDYWAAPASYFLVTGGLLKEAVEDLEWPGSAVGLCLVRDPAAIRLSASGTGSLEVQVDAAALSGLQVAAAEVLSRYRYKNLRAALCNIPAARDVGGSVSTKVSIDANGLLKVTHMVPLGGRRGPGGGGGSAAGAAAASLPAALSAFTSTQAAMDASKIGILQFVSLPVEEDEE